MSTRIYFSSNRSSSPNLTVEFQRLYTPTAFREERILWRAVIQLNLVRSIRMILDAISTPIRSVSSHYPRSVASSSRRRPRRLTIHDSDTRGRQPLPQLQHRHGFPPNQHDPHTHAHHHSDPGGPASASSSSRRLEDMPPIDGDALHEYIEPEPDYDSDDDSPYISHVLEALKMRLLPVRHIEALLIAKLVPPNEDEPVHMGMGASGQGTEIGSSWRRDEVFVRSGTGWKGVLAKAVRMHARTESGVSADTTEGNGHKRSSSSGTSVPGMPDEPQEVLHACRQDIMSLWNDPTVREILRRKKIRLEELPGL